MGRSQAVQTAQVGAAPFFAGKNKIINGDFFWNQRNFSTLTTNQGYGFDRWILQHNGLGTITNSTQTFTPGTAPVAGYEGKTFCRMETSGQTANNAFAVISQRIESVRTLANTAVVISFWAKAASGTPSVSVELQQNFGTGGSPSASVQTLFGKQAITTTWTRYSLTTTLPSISGKTIGTTNDGYVELNFWTSGGSDFNARTNSLGNQNATIDFWGVQVEAGSVATPFQTATGTLQGELAACQRYYVRFTAGTVYARYGTGSFESTTRMAAGIVLPVTMRVAPTVGEQSNLATWDFATVRAATAITLDAGTTPNIAQLVVDIASGGTAFRPAMVLANNTTNSYLAFGAEL